MPRDVENRFSQEIIGLLLLGAGTLLFLALITYDPRDVPDWFLLSSHTGTQTAPQTIFGRTGAIIACLSNFLIGAASFFLAVTLFGYGMLKIIHPGWPLLRRLPWAGVFILTTACLAHFQPGFLRPLHLAHYAAQMELHGPAGTLCPGGQIGYWLGTLFQTLFDRTGSMILLLVVYLVSLIMMTGLNPLTLLRKAIGLIPKAIARYRQWRLDRADEQERLEIERRKLEKEARKLERELKRKGVQPKNEESAPDDDDEGGI